MMRGWTQSQLAKAVSKDPGTISKIVSGRIMGNPPTMKAIADVLGIPMEELIIENDPAA